LGDAKTAGGLSHTAHFDDGQQDIEIAQFEAAFGSIVPWHERPFPLVM
jgi:hypothetical protein